MNVDYSKTWTCYKGKEKACGKCGSCVERLEAFEKAKEALDKLDAGKPFNRVAQYYSDDPSNKDLGGTLSTPVTGDGTYVYDFEQAALALEENGQNSDIIKTEFGYHIISADKVSNDVTEPQYKYTIL